jgi:trimeric autotransporter adhesin
MPNLSMTPELEQAVRAASSPEAITSAIQAELARQTSAAEAEAATAAAAKAAADKMAADATAAANTGTGFTRTEVIGGREFIFTAGSEAELNGKVLDAYRVAYALGTGTVQEEVQVDPVAQAAVDAAAQAAAEVETARQTDLGLKFQRGEISVKEYLEESGAVSEYLAKEGISIADLKETVQKTQDSTYTQDWQAATSAFLAGPGSEWPGGDVNKFNLQNTLVALDLMDADDKVGALVKAYEYMKQNGALIPYVPPADTTTQATDTASATGTTIAPGSVSAATPRTDAEIQAIVQAAVSKALADQANAVEAAKSPRTSSSMFGASSGVSGGSVVGSTEAKVRSDAATTAALKDASPAEILDAWKAAQVAGGKNPNEAFLEQFSSRRPA